MIVYLGKLICINAPPAVLCRLKVCDLPGLLSWVYKFEMGMYIDTVVVSGLVIVVLVCVMAAYIGVFAYKHIKQDVAASEKPGSQK